MQDENIRILIVDDNPVNVKVLMGSLADLNYKLLIAQTGLKAIQVAEKAIPELILLDINLPEMNGYDVCRHLKNNPQTAHIPIIFISALDDVESKITGLTIGGVDYITKPFYKEEVIKRVETQLKIFKLTASLKAQNDALAQKNDELVRVLTQLNLTQELLTQAHEQVTDSIAYARRIQRALLAPEAQIKKSLPNSFLFYRPRDVVSGDFYFFADVNPNLTIIAAVDCTGHGVPGAIMSVIGFTQLNSIITEKRILDPGQILVHLDKNVRQILKQEQSESGQTTQDGMDIALLAYNRKENSLSFSGANLSLHFIRNQELHEIKGDKNPIGGTFYEEKEFTTYNLSLEKGDRCYISSDGYPDQFGGEKGKKLTTKRFQELLLRIHLEPFEVQNKLIISEFESWKGKQDQLDDVLVIGLGFL